MFYFLNKKDCHAPSANLRGSNQDAVQFCFVFCLTITFHLQAVNQLCAHFEAYRDIPKIIELREKFKSIKQMLKSHVFSDFSRYVSFLKF
jgi:hypothetical protein